MPMVLIDEDELWPHYLVSDDGGVECEIPPDKLAWVDRVEGEFRRVQEYLRELVKAARRREQ